MKDYMESSYLFIPLPLAITCVLATCVFAGCTFWLCLPDIVNWIKRMRGKKDFLMPGIVYDFKFNDPKGNSTRFKPSEYQKKKETDPIFDYPINNLNESVNTGLIDSIISGVGSAGIGTTKDVEYGGGSFGGAGASDSWNDSPSDSASSIE